MKEVIWLVVNKQSYQLAQGFAKHLSDIERTIIVNTSTRFNQGKNSQAQRMSNISLITFCAKAATSRAVKFRVPHLSYDLVKRKRWRILVLILRLRPSIVEYYEDGMHLALEIADVDNFIRSKSSIYCFYYQGYFSCTAKRKEWKLINELSLQSCKKQEEMHADVGANILLLICSKYMCRTAAVKLINEYRTMHDVGKVLVVLHPNEAKNIYDLDSMGIGTKVEYIRLNEDSLEEWITQNKHRIKAYAMGMTGVLLFICYQKKIKVISGEVYITVNRNGATKEKQSFIGLAARLERMNLCVVRGL